MWGPGTRPAVCAFDVRVAVKVGPVGALFAGSRGRKFRNEPMICASNWAGAVVSDATALRNSPVGRSRPMNDRPLAPDKLSPIGTVEPESETIESTVTVVA